ncbi:MAG: glycosyltransferase family 4 protein [Burkholderiaceae bacterium]|nr:glycosyltransferase family 4 protein [Burkholderiaceae bacterium]
MKLAIIRRRYNPFGGAERFIERLTPRLAQRGINATILAEDWPGTQGTTPVIPVKAAGWTRTARLRAFQQAVKSQLGPFDLVQSHERMVGVDIFRLGDGVHAAWIKRLQQEASGLRSLWLNIDPYHRAVIETERAMAEDPKLHYVANSSLVATELAEYWSVPDHRITLIPNGVDTRFFTPATSAQKAEARQALAQQYAISITPETLLICLVGSGFSRKGVFQLIQACARLKNCALLICGKDKESAKARALIGESNAANRIALTGPLQDVRPLLWASDIFALPSLYDPSSNAVLEALSCGLPVIVTRDVGMAWEITDADAGLICERHISGLLQALHKCEDVDRRNSMAARARAFALRYEQNIVIDQWLEFYKRMQACRN